jgi:O-succinylbenzoic acid--CoA ligase
VVALHPKFKFNGLNLSESDLIEIAYSFIKEGQEFEQEIGEFLLNWLDATAEITVHTSGSTGLPKEISLLKEHMVNSAKATGSYFNLKPSQKALLCLPARYIAGKMMLVRAMVLGLALDTVAPIASPLNFTNKHYDFCAMVPLQVQNSLQQLGQIKTLIIGGAAVSNSLKTQLAACDVNAYETYGMTETITHVAIKELTKDSANQTFIALPNVHFLTDERGCLVIDAPRISKEKVFTNDLVELINENQFNWLGRFDTIINSGGVKLIPEQIEERLKRIISIPFFLAGIPDEKLGEKLVLILEGKKSIVEPILQKIEASTALTQFEKPKKAFSAPTFLRTTTGKVQRTATLDIVLGNI